MIQAFINAFRIQSEKYFKVVVMGALRLEPLQANIFAPFLKPTTAPNLASETTAYLFIDETVVDRQNEKCFLKSLLKVWEYSLVSESFSTDNLEPPVNYKMPNGTLSHCLTSPGARRSILPFKQ